MDALADRVDRTLPPLMPSGDANGVNGATGDLNDKDIKFTIIHH